ncbi:MAG: hypothetical protein A4E53_02377 [Pelotomaculum sp. PtaB.Bin104]|nr:MAG: hypothetical protein A4E53_02377 [Pelotomaculum sp. PtaB.Bin104]
MGTPIPSRERELSSRGSGYIFTYQLSQEELARYGPPKPRRTKSRPFDTSRIAEAGHCYRGDA